MSEPLSIEKVKEWFEILLRTEATENDNELVFNIERDSVSKEFLLSKDSITNIIQKFETFKTSDDTALYNTSYYEILVREESRMPFASRRRGEALNQEDTDNGVHYELSPPSNEYLLFLLDKVNQIGSIRDFFRRGISSSMFWRRIEELGEDIGIFDIIKMQLLRYPTLKIRTNKNFSLDQLSKYSMSFIFNLSFNSEYTIVPQRYIDDLFRFKRSLRIRRCPLEEIDPPRRFYTNDLIYHYQMALSSESPFLEYISFFHIAEHFFEFVFSDELTNKIKTELTSPNFSYKRKKDIQVLVKTISKAIQYRNEKMIFNENEALKLTIIRFVNLTELKQNLEDYNPTLIEYFKNHTVPFSKGSKIDFSDSDESKVYKTIANRIYMTRNALVHSKDGDKSKYTPFYDDKDLLPELPLLRLISEMIILGSSKIIE